MAVRSWLTMIFMAVLVLMFFPALVSGNETLSIVVNSLVLVASLMFCYANGASLGESEITYGDVGATLQTLLNDVMEGTLPNEREALLAAAVK